MWFKEVPLLLIWIIPHFPPTFLPPPLIPPPLFCFVEHSRKESRSWKICCFCVVRSYRWSSWWVFAVSSRSSPFRLSNLPLLFLPPFNSNFSFAASTSSPTLEVHFSASRPAILVYVHAKAENFFVPLVSLSHSLMQRINIVFFWATSSPSQRGRHLSITPENPVNCISGYRLCTLTLKRLVLSRPLGSDLGSVVIAVKMQVSLPILVKKTRLGDSCQWLSLSTQ